MSARTVADPIRNECGISLCPRTIQKKVKEGKIRCLPLRRGPKGNIPELHYKNLCAAYELFVTINQVNGNMQMCSVKKYGPLIFKVVYGDCEGCRVDCSELLKRVLRDTACNLNKCKFHTTPKTGTSDGQTTGTSPCGLTIGSMILWSWGLLFTTQQQGRFISRRISLG
jgi:hypothetical protein